jgi:hypothetical protein
MCRADGTWRAQFFAPSLLVVLRKTSGGESPIVSAFPPGRPLHQPRTPQSHRRPVSESWRGIRDDVGRSDGDATLAPRAGCFGKSAAPVASESGAGLMEGPMTPGVKFSWMMAAVAVILFALTVLWLHRLARAT